MRLLVLEDTKPSKGSKNANIMNMLCGCQSSAKTRHVMVDCDAESTYYGADNDKSVIMGTVASDSWCQVLKCDQPQYPGYSHTGSSKSTKKSPSNHSNQAFDSGVESGATDSLQSLKMLDMRGSAPMLKFTEREPRQRSDVSECSSTQSRMFQTYKGQLKLGVYMNSGLLTVHIKEAKHLVSKWSSVPCPFVKVQLYPDDLCKSQCRTKPQMDTFQPTFNEKFSFELIHGDMNKRILVTLWSKDPNHNKSEMLGSMSFGIKHIVEGKNTVQGWYFLLSEQVGRRKHLQAHNKRHLVVDMEEYQSTVADSTTAYTDSGTSMFDSTFSSTTTLTESDTSLLHINRGASGYGFTLSGGFPAQVFTVEPGSHAERAGLKSGETVLRINGQDMSRASADTVARVVRFSQTLDIEVGASVVSKPWFSSTPANNLKVSRERPRVSRSSLSPPLSSSQYTDSWNRFS